MKNPKKDLFTVGQMCKVCGISRSTVLRMESKGKELGLKPNGYLRGLRLVAPYMGKESDPDKFVSRYVLPVKE